MSKHAVFICYHPAGLVWKISSFPLQGGAFFNSARQDAAAHQKEMEEVSSSLEKSMDSPLLLEQVSLVFSGRPFRVIALCAKHPFSAGIANRSHKASPLGLCDWPCDKVKGCRV